MADDAFIRDLREKLIQRTKADQENTRRENLEYDLIKEKAPEDWKRLKAWLKEKAAQLPAEIVTHEEELDSVVIRCRFDREARVTKIQFHHVDRIMAHIKVESRGGGVQGDVTFECDVQGRNLSWFYSTNEEARFTLEEIGKNILTRATHEI
jgi:hypothetical protein